MWYATGVIKIMAVIKITPERIFKVEQLSFNSSVDRDDYAIIKDEAFKRGITVKEHISAIVTEYARKAKLEAEGKKDEDNSTH
jgi:hypothetical protein